MGDFEQALISLMSLTVLSTLTEEYRANTITPERYASQVAKTVEEAMLHLKQTVEKK